MSNYITKKELGQKGEDLAVIYLLDKGYEILCRNHRFKRAEIDIITRKNNRIIFVEVKVRTNSKFGNPEEFVSDNQKKLIKYAAEEYILANDWQQNIRFDIISIDAQSNITQFKDAF